MEGRPKLFDFHGVSMIHYFTDNWENVKNFKARPDDILIATYPKAGTTWVSQMVDLLLFGKSCPERQATVPIYERVPFLELNIPGLPSDGTAVAFEPTQGTKLADNMTTSPRVIKTHLPVQLTPQSFFDKNSKIIYVARNAKDNVVSYYHFDRMNAVEPDPGDWPSFIERFHEGKMVFGSWYDHVKGWWERSKKNPKILYLFYEDLTEDLSRELDKVCTFLGISPTEEEKKEVIGHIQFNSMKEDKMANYSTIGVMNFEISPFMRKGKVGDWKNHFTVAENVEFDRIYQKKMANTTLHFRTEM